MIARFVRHSVPALVLVATSLLAGCRDGTSPEAGMIMTGRLGVQSWQGDASARLELDETGDPILHLFGSAPRGNLGWPHEVIHVQVPFDGPGRYELSGDQVDVTILLGGDVRVGSYTGVGTSAGVLEISEYDNDPVAVVAGTLSFEAELTFGDSEHGSRFVFHGGRFRSLVLSLTPGNAILSPRSTAERFDVSQHQNPRQLRAARDGR